MTVHPSFHTGTISVRNANASKRNNQTGRRNRVYFTLAPGHPNSNLICYLSSAWLHLRKESPLDHPCNHIWLPLKGENNYEHCYTFYLGVASYRGIAGVALQLRLGILSQWRIGLDLGHRVTRCVVEVARRSVAESTMR